MRFFISISAAVPFCLIGCAALSSQAIMPDLTKAEATAVITDCTSLLATQFPPAQTVLHIAAGASDFQTAFVQALRDRGFAVAAQPTEDSHPVGYHIVALDDKTLLVRLTVADEWGANRIYLRTPDRKSLPADSVFAIRTNDDNPPTFLKPEPPPGQPATAAPRVAPPEPGAFAVVAVAPSIPDQSDKSPPQAAPEPAPTSPPPAPAVIQAASEPEQPLPPVPVVIAHPTTPAPVLPDVSKAIVPNSDGVIEFSPQLLDPIDHTDPNPFVVRYQVPTVYRNIPVAITATVDGPRPTATINGRMVNVGDEWDEFTIAAVARDAVYFRKNQFLLKIPIARERAYTIRLPE